MKIVEGMGTVWNPSMKQSTDYGHSMKAQIKNIRKIGPMWQTRSGKSTQDKMCCAYKSGSGSEFSAVH